MAMDGIELEILWSNLVSAASEQARALQRIAFSPVVREAGDLACALLDREGRMIAQAVTGTPGHINTLAAAGAHFVEKFPTDSLTEGDILITNDPWLSAGHFFDITIITPVFRKGRVIAYFGSTIHHTDIGGYGVGAGARDVHEEGLWIPRAKLYEAGKPNEVLFDIIRHNVRTKDEVMGDIAAQVSSGKVGAERLQLLCDRHNLDDIDDLSAEIIKRSEAATRDSIRKLKGGTYHGESRFDIPGGAEILLKCAMTIDADAGSVHIDFEGSSGASPHGVNVVLNYTHAYATFALRSTLDPDLPNNYGSSDADHGVAHRRLYRQREIPVAGGRAPCGRHVCTDADPESAAPGCAPTRCWPKAPARSGHSRCRARTTQAIRSPAPCSTIPAAWGQGAPRTASAPPATRPASRQSRSRCWKPPCRSSSPRKN